MTVALLDINLDGPEGGPVAKDTSVRLFPSKEAALQWFKEAYEPDPDYCEAATDEFEEQVKDLTEIGVYSHPDGPHFVIVEVQE